MSTSEGLYVVHVCDQTTAALTGHEGHEYSSPPQERERAIALLEVLLGRPERVKGEGEAERQWRRPIAGGQRSVTLRRAS